MMRYPFTEMRIIFGGEYAAGLFLIREFGRDIGLTEEFVNHRFRYRLRESPNAMGLWVSYNKAVELAKQVALKKKQNLERALSLLKNQ